MALMHRDRARGRDGEEGLWVECPFCREIHFRKEVERLLWVCPQCDYHYPISVDRRVRLTADDGTFRELWGEIRSTDPLGFKDQRHYRDRLREARQGNSRGEAMVCGEAEIKGRRVFLGIQDFSFLGGSMGYAVGERLARAAEAALESRTPLVVFAASGGARMQEGLLSLMQMAKVSVAIGRLKDTGVPLITVLTDPTTGGVAASFAMQGDVILAEPRARVGFAGPRVIENTMREKLPEGFQRAEYLLEHGLIDAIVSRSRIRDRLDTLLGLLTDSVCVGEGRDSATSSDQAGAPEPGTGPIDPQRGG